MNRTLSTFALLLAAMPATAQPGPWANFGRAGALNHIAEKVEVMTDGIDGGRLQYRLRFTRTTLHGTTTQWTDSRTCRPLRALIGSMRDVAMPHPAPYGFDDDKRDIILDGASYSLTAPSSDPSGQFTVSSNVGSPLAKWIDAALDTLAPCWSNVEPRR